MATTRSVPQAAAHGNERDRRELITPEGVPLVIELAGRGERAAALIIDLSIILGSIIAVVVAGLALGLFSAPGTAMSFVLLASFALRSFYFIFFELRWHGATPGKRALALRVIDRGGGRLRADAVFARNLMREVELFLPLSLLLGADQAGSGSWVILLTLVWTSVFTLMPVFNKDRLRAGDIIAGTWVIVAPKSVLLPDMVEAAASPSPTKGATPSGYNFSKRQLEIYGIYELQTLETVLRQKGLDAQSTQDTVSMRIQRKLAWKQTGKVDSRRFLEDFYAALREHLETKMLFGERRESKHDRPATRVRRRK